ncbi:MAG: SDR family oxidoreductase [Chloroflexi bacterium]|nr:SDR family oxidoreductase [Chloroflexota bacterium]
MKVHGSVALVTGASRGLGLEIAKIYAGLGANLVIAARGREDLEAVARELRPQTEVVALALDVSQEAERLVEAALERFGRIDVLVNNASELGPSPMPALEEYPWQDLQRVFRVNVLAPLHLAQLVLPGMRARGEGVIINVTSDAGVEAYPGWGGYGASKAALEHVSRTLAAELEGTGVRVYVVDPGDMNTAMHRLAEPGVDLSDLPGPEASAPAFVQLVEEETAPFARIKAQEIVAVAG